VKLPLRILLLTILGCYSISSSAASGWMLNSGYLPRLTIVANTQRNSLSGIGDIMIPLIGDRTTYWDAGNSGSLLYLDYRLKRTSKLFINYSYAFGYRKFMNGLLCGFYVFNDKMKTRNQNFFYQVNFGGEMFTNNWDYRLNVYYPYGKTSRIFSRSLKSSDIREQEIFFNRSKMEEFILAGAFLEIGRKVPLIPRLRAYGGYYHFGFGYAEPAIDGAEIRFVFKILPYLKFMAQERYDRIRKSQPQLGLRLDVGGVPPETDTSELARRMQSFVIRNMYDG